MEIIILGVFWRPDGTSDDARLLLVNMLVEMIRLSAVITYLHLLVLNYLELHVQGQTCNKEKVKQMCYRQK